ncbi:hypothetical protein ACVND7_11985, partial [Avibacterium paragallinarum]
MKTNLKTWLAVLGLVSLVMPNVVIAKDEDSGKTSGKPTLEEFKDSIGEWLEDCRENPEGERCTEEELKEDMLDLIDKLDDKARGEARKWLKEEKGYNLDKSPGPKEPETPPDSGITNSETPTPQPPSQPQQPTMSWLALAPRVNLEQ